MVALLASQTALPSFGQTCLDIILYPFTHLYALLAPSIGPIWANLLSITLICVFLTGASFLIIYLCSSYIPTAREDASPLLKSAASYTNLGDPPSPPPISHKASSFSSTQRPEPRQPLPPETEDRSFTAKYLEPS